jgi:hypothetical protein
MKRIGIPKFVLLMGFCTLGCAHLRYPAEPQQMDAMTSSSLQERWDSICPYKRFRLYWPNQDSVVPVSNSNTQISSRIGSAYSAFLEGEGFRHVDRGEDAYWSAAMLASHSLRDSRYAIWFLHITATQDRRGRLQVPVGFMEGDWVKGEKQPEYKGITIGQEFLVADMYEVVQNLALQTAKALRPHTVRMCNDWNTGRTEEEARLEELRRELASEIQQIRLHRARERQRKELEMEIERSSEP